MRQFVYTVYLPGQKKTVQIKELQFNRFKHLVKVITNNNDEIVASFFDDLLIDLCQDEPDITQFTFIDKLIMLLTIRAICISPSLELTITCPVTKKQFNTNTPIQKIIDKLQELDLPDDIYNSTIKCNDNLIINLGMPSTLNIKERDLSIINTVIKSIYINRIDVTKNKEQIFDRLPVTILKDIKIYIEHFDKTLKDINLLSVISPYSPSQDEVNVPLNLFSNSVIEFLKICFKRSLLSFYEIEYFLINKLNIDYELIKTSTPAELNVYINFYKDERKKEDEAEQKKSLNLPTR